MRGSIKERSPGHFAIILEQRDATTGKRRRKWHSFKGTKRQAQVECARLIFEMRSGTYLESSKVTVVQFFERWLRHIKANVSPRTHERYEQIAMKNIAPLIGAKVLSKLTPIEIGEAYTQALEKGQRDGKAVYRLVQFIICTAFSFPPLIKPNAGRWSAGTPRRCLRRKIALR